MSADNHGRTGLPILRSVSRSFYLSIRILPMRLREPVALGYLLARSTDTIADTASVPVGKREEGLQRLAEIIQGEAPREEVVDLLPSFLPLQTNPHERALLENLPVSLEWLEQLNSDDLADVRAVLEKITRGQMLDLLRFGDPAEVRALKGAPDLDEYTYLVAGCVGEFWTRLCFRHIRNFADLSGTQMLRLGTDYGMGLQLINILRDAGADLHAGRCYFPIDELAQQGLAPDHILREPERFYPIYAKWMKQAERDLIAGIQYSRAIRNPRVRAATVLPALIGNRTIALLHSAGPTALHRTLKIPRREVRWIVTSLLFTCASRRRISALFQEMKP